ENVATPADELGKERAADVLVHDQLALEVVPRPLVARHLDEDVAAAGELDAPAGRRGVPAPDRIPRERLGARDPLDDLALGQWFNARRRRTTKRWPCAHERNPTSTPAGIAPSTGARRARAAN